MSDKPIGAMVATLIAAPLAVLCCAVGPAAFLAIVSGGISGGVAAVFGELGLAATLLFAAVCGGVFLPLRMIWSRRKSRNALEGASDT